MTPDQSQEGRPPTAGGAEDAAVPDPWDPSHRPRGSPDWNDPRGFWWHTLRAVHAYGSLARSYKPREPERARKFWDLLRSCPPLAGLWDHRPVDEVHAAVLALAWVHWRGIERRDPHRSPQSPPLTDAQERHAWRWWAKWLQETVEVLHDVPERLLAATDRDRELQLLSSAAAQAAVWAKTGAPGQIRIVSYTPGEKDIILEFPPAHTQARRRVGRPSSDKGKVIYGEFAALDTFLRPILCLKGPRSRPIVRPIWRGRGGYWKVFAEIIRHFSGLDSHLTDSFSETLRVEIAQVRRSHPKYVSQCEHGVRIPVRRREIDPLDTAF